MIHTIVLDLDGPILDGAHRHYRCYADILDAHGQTPLGFDVYWRMKRERLDRRQILAASHSQALYDTFLAEWMQAIETQPYLLLDRLQGRVAQVLDELRQDGRRILVATMRNHRANTEWQLEHLGIARRIDHLVVVGSRDAGENKATEVLPLLSGTPLDQVVWVGDTEVDIAAARRIGVRVCALECGLRTREYLQALSPDMLHPDLNSFARTLRCPSRIAN